MPPLGQLGGLVSETIIGRPAAPRVAAAPEIAPQHVLHKQGLLVERATQAKVVREARVRAVLGRKPIMVLQSQSRGARDAGRAAQVRQRQATHGARDEAGDERGDGGARGTQTRRDGAERTAQRRRLEALHDLAVQAQRAELRVEAEPAVLLAPALVPACAEADHRDFSQHFRMSSGVTGILKNINKQAGAKEAHVQQRYEM
mmetsp:Transcript_23704/g.94022  ORF Transcript_23704/g.94022 Transcript_23704/m.94022 type:complete len:202 (+) Transcript_23704:396-1001(+)